MYAISSGVWSGRSVSKITEVGYEALCTDMAVQSVRDSSERTHGEVLPSTYSAYGMYIEKTISRDVDKYMCANRVKHLVRQKVVTNFCCLSCVGNISQKYLKIHKVVQHLTSVKFSSIADR